MPRRSNPLAPPIPELENPPVPRVRRRRAPTNEYRHVREVKGGAFQARVWLGAHSGGSLNLGLFTVSQWETREHAEWAAGRASKEFRKRYRPGTGLRTVLESLMRDGLIPAHVLPPRVRANADGSFVGRVKLPKKGMVLETPPFSDPWIAYEEMCGMLGRAFPRGPSKSDLNAQERARRRRAQLERERRRYAGGLLFA